MIVCYQPSFSFCYKLKKKTSISSSYVRTTVGRICVNRCVVLASLCVLALGGKTKVEGMCQFQIQLKSDPPLHVFGVRADGHACHAGQETVPLRSTVVRTKKVKAEKTKSTNNVKR